MNYRLHSLSQVEQAETFICWKEMKRHCTCVVQNLYRTVTSVLVCPHSWEVRKSFWCTGCCLLHLWHFGGVNSAPPIRYKVLTWESIPVRSAFTYNLMWCMLTPATTSKLAHLLKLGFWPAATFWPLNDDWVPLKHQAAAFMALTFSGLTSVVFCNRTPVTPCEEPVSALKH